MANLVAITLFVSAFGLQDAAPVELESGSILRMRHAKQLADQGQYEESLKEYLWCFDEGFKQEPALIGVRGSFLLGEIAELGKKYPPATDALKSRRETAVTNLKAVKGTFTESMAEMELKSLSNALGVEVTDEELGETDEDNEKDANGGWLGRLLTARASTRKVETPKRVWPELELPAATETRAPACQWPYQLNQSRFDTELANSRGDEQRLQILGRRWNEVGMAVAYCSATNDYTSFHHSMAYWNTGYLSSGTWKLEVSGDLLEVPDGGSKETVLIRGDCRADLKVRETIHIYGDLTSKLVVRGLSEVVIGGSILSTGSVHTDDIARIFVGGDVDGRISNKGSAFVWVSGDFTGVMEAGEPNLGFHVMGDFTGTLDPNRRAAMMSLNVRGFIDGDVLNEIAVKGWTQFSASVGSSDIEPGIYSSPSGGTASHVVHSKR